MSLFRRSVFAVKSLRKKSFNHREYTHITDVDFALSTSAFRQLCMNHTYRWKTSLSLIYSKKCEHATRYISRDVRFPTMWYVRPANAQTSLCIRAIWSEPLLVARIFYKSWVSKVKRRLHRLVRVNSCQNSCQNAALLEITCHGSLTKTTLAGTLPAMRRHLL